jgi:predicted transglutaminase-like cysteine proteinase
MRLMNTFLKVAIAAFSVIATSGTVAEAASPNLFGTVEYRNESLDALPQWQRAMAVVQQNQAAYRACAEDEARCGNPRLAQWQAMVQSQQGRSQMAQIEVVNRFINGWRYRSDADNYGKSDYWATPSEFFQRSGNCEDYAITKYVTLRQLGFAADQLRLVVVRDTVRDLAHAVLAVYVEGEIFILDNLSSKVMPQNTVTHYAPYYSVNETARWAHQAPAAAVARISLAAFSS